MEKTYLADAIFSTLNKNGQVEPTRMHYHLEMHFAFVMEGRAFASATNAKETLHEGDDVFVAPMTLHSAAPDAKTGARMFCLNLLPSSSTEGPASCLSQSLPVSAVPELRFRVFRKGDRGAAGRVLDTLARLAGTWDEPVRGSERQRDYRVLADCIAALSRTDDRREKSPDDPAADRFVRLRDCAFAHCEENLPPEEVATRCGLSRTEADEAVASMGEGSLAALLRETRPQQARHLLLQGTLSAKEIAHRLRFSSPSNFGALFRARFGMSPRRMRGVPGG